MATGVVFYRKLRGLTQATLAKRLGVDAGTMSRIETGAWIPSAKQVDQLSDLLHVPPSRLFTDHVLSEVAERARAAEAAAS